MLYRQTNFSLSDTSQRFIKNLYKDFFEKNFEHDADYETLRFMWKFSPLAKDLRPFLQQYKIDLNNCIVNTFVSNTPVYTKTNPHVDVTNNGSLLPIKTRFNILILGNSYDPMIWWKNFEFGNQIYKTRDFHVGNQTYKSLVVPGDSVDDRLKFLGSPSVVKHNLLTPSAFVNTFVAHALEISPGPRLVLSVGIDKEIDKIII